MIKRIHDFAMTHTVIEILDTNSPALSHLCLLRVAVLLLRTKVRRLCAYAHAHVTLLSAWNRKQSGPKKVTFSAGRVFNPLPIVAHDCNVT